MKSSVICLVIALLFASLFPAVVTQGSANTAWQRLNANVSKAKTFFLPTFDKLLPLRKGVAGALIGTLIYASGMLPYAVAAPEATQSSPIIEIQHPRNAMMVMVKQSNGKQLLMPVHKSKHEKNFVVNPVTISEFSDYLAVFVDSTKNHEAKDQVNRVLQYWDEHFGAQGKALLAAVDAVRAAKKRVGLEGDYIPSSKEVRELEQQLAFLKLEELTASLNAALKVEDVSNTSDSDLKSGLMRAYKNSGYIKVALDTEGRATLDSENKLYDYFTISSADKVRLAYKTSNEASPAREPEKMRLMSRYRDGLGYYGIIMERATVYGHLGFVSTLLMHGHDTNLDKYMHIALEIGHTEIAKTIFKRTKVNGQINLNAALKKAASNRRNEMAMLLYEAGGDVNEGLVGAAVGGDVELAKYFIAAGATDINRALQDTILYGDEGAFHVATYLATLDGIDLNAALELAAAYAGEQGGYTDWIKHFIHLGADNFNEALLAFAYNPSDFDLDGAKLLMERASNLDHVLSRVLESEIAVTNDDFTMYQEELVRMLIRSGASIEDGLITLGLYDGRRAAEEEALRRIFAEETGR